MEGGLRSKGIVKKTGSDTLLVSIITVVFNRKSYIEQAVLSVLDQSYENIEYIIIDAGSTDGTLDTIKKYNDRIDFWISEPDGGMYYALNKGIDFANGELIGICHSDDYYYSNKVIEKLVSVHKKEDADVYHGDMISISEQGLLSNRIISNAALITKTHKSILHPTTFIKKEVLKSIGYYNTNYRSASDYELMLRLKLNHCKFYHLGIIVYAMRMGTHCQVSNNCYGHLEAYRFHKDLQTGNHSQYLFSFLNCITRRFVKWILRKIRLYHK